ncbi:MAG: GntR family transcriptional regulator [Actinomycetota bacterium]
MSPQPLDRSQPLPLWAQLEQDLRRRLNDGEFDSGQFPTDLELTETYEVSRHTVREAIRHLNKTGLLSRQRGKGTVINRAEFEQSLGTLYSLFNSIESSGGVQRSEVLEFGERPDAEAASHLGVDDGTPLTLLARLRFADDEPLAIDRAWLPRTGTGLDAVDWSRTALYRELERAGLSAPNQGWERLTPIIPTPTDRKLLGLRSRDAAFFLERLGLHDDSPVEWRTTIIRGDRYRFVSDWSRGIQSSLRPAALTQR